MTHKTRRYRTILLNRTTNRLVSCMSLLLKKAICILVIGFLLISQVACASLVYKANDATSAVSDGAKSVVESLSSGATGLFNMVAAPKDADQFEDILNAITTQNIAVFISELSANVDFSTMLDKLNSIKSTVALQLSAEDLKLARIADEIKAARDFIDAPEHIFGDIPQKHGEIAERMDVAARNARRIAAGLEPDATFENVSRTAPEDYIVAGKMVQSKFYNNPRATLDSIIQHNNDYSYFGKNGTSYYVVPKDQYAIYQQINSGAPLADMEIYYEGSRYRLTSLQNMAQDIKEIERRTGRKFADVVKPSEFNYSDVQLNQAAKSLDNLSSNSNERVNASKTMIKQSADVSKRAAIIECIKTDFVKVGQAAAIGFGLDAIISAGFSIYEKLSEGKNIEGFTEEDWKDIGTDSLSGGFRGATIGAGTLLLSIFGLPAPFAGVLVATIFQTMVLYNSYSSGEIHLDEFLSQALDFCITSSIVMSGAMIGQMIIPVPILGAIVGGLAAGITVEVVKIYASPIDRISEIAEDFADDFSVRYNELLDSAAGKLESASDTTRTTLATAYANTKTCVSEAIIIATDNVTSTVEALR